MKGKSKVPVARKISVEGNKFLCVKEYQKVNSALEKLQDATVSDWWGDSQKIGEVRTDVRRLEGIANKISDYLDTLRDAIGDLEDEARNIENAPRNP